MVDVLIMGLNVYLVFSKYIINIFYNFWKFIYKFTNAIHLNSEGPWKEVEYFFYEKLQHFMKTTFL